MVTIVKVLIPIQFAPVSFTTQYKAVNSKAIIDKFTATNLSSRDVLLYINILERDFNITPGNVLVSGRLISPGESYIVPEITGHVIEANGAISVSASSNSSLTIRASGREIS